MLRSLLCAGLFLDAVIAVGAPPVIPPAKGDPPPVRVDAPKVKSAAPDLDIPAEVRPSGQYVQFTPKTTAVSVTYVGLDGVDAVPAVLLKDGRVFLLDVRGLKDGRYRFVAVAAGKTGEQTRADFAVTVGKVGPKPDDPAPPPPKPVDPPPPAASLYFLVVRADGPADPAFTRTMALPAWAQLRAAGHSVKDKTLTEARALGVGLPAGTPLPAVVTLRVSGGTSTIVRPAVPLPTTDAGVADLPTGVR